jgi:tRNA threonylcarbamoyladenosine biosynthesis protein TsaE
MKKRIINTSNPKSSLTLAEKIGRRLRGGEVIELVSDLGGGKTTFVRGLGRGIGSHNPVRSPSFTLSNEYHAERLTLYHFDFYRLNEAGILRDELKVALADPMAVIAVEWGDILGDVLPPRRLSIHLRVTGPSQRELTLEYPADLNYLIEET